MPELLSVWRKMMPVPDYSKYIAADIRIVEGLIINGSNTAMPRSIDSPPHLSPKDKSRTIETLGRSIYGFGCANETVTPAHTVRASP
ncbi:hypothetical protein C5167_041389 [Papaver somniferum]|nr:hypothetical protein C5167_041389 [Papaver somniferum]